MTRRTPPGGQVRRGPAPRRFRPRLRFRLGPLRVVALATVALGLALTAYGVFSRGVSAIPALITGLGCIGLAGLVLAFDAVRVVIRAGDRGDGRAAFLAALFGGLAALAGAGALAGAIVLALLWRTAAA